MHLLLLLETRERASARELAAALEVSVRTVHRDIDALGRAGIAVYAERGPRGGFRLLGGRRFQINALTDAEAGALPLSGVPAVAAQLGFAEPAGAAWLKVESALPESQRERATRTTRHVLVDLESGTEATDRVPAQLLRGLWRAVNRHRSLSLRTRDAAGAIFVQGVDPLGLVWSEHAWLVVARARGRVVSIPVSSIELARATDATFESPGDFVLERWWRAHARPTRR